MKQAFVLRWVGLAGQRFAPAGATAVGVSMLAEGQAGLGVAWLLLAAGAAATFTLMAELASKRL